MDKYLCYTHNCSGVNFFQKKYWGQPLEIRIKKYGVTYRVVIIFLRKKIIDLLCHRSNFEEIWWSTNLFSKALFGKIIVRMGD
jgi:hypothetical protein